MGTAIIMASTAFTPLPAPYSICTPTSVLLAPDTKDAERNEAMWWREGTPDIGVQLIQVPKSTAYKSAQLQSFLSLQ